jgi:hypothetical protein
MGRNPPRYRFKGKSSSKPEELPPFEYSEWCNLELNKVLSLEPDILGPKDRPERSLEDTLEIYNIQEIPIEERRLTSIYEANLTRKRLRYTPKPGGARDEAHYNELIHRRRSYDLVKRIHFEVVLKVLERRNLYSFAIGDGETILDQLAECHAHLETLERILAVDEPGYKSIQDMFHQRSKEYISNLASEEVPQELPLLKCEKGIETRDFILFQHQDLSDAESMIYECIMEKETYPDFFGTFLWNDFHIREGQTEQGILAQLSWIISKVDPFKHWVQQPSMEGSWHEKYFFQRVVHYLVRGHSLVKAMDISFEETLERKPEEGGDWYDDLKSWQLDLHLRFPSAPN